MFNIRRLGTNEVIEIDTPNVSVTLDQPGIYRMAVDEDGNSRISVRRGRAVIAASGRQITVENSEIRIYGIDSPNYEIVALPGTGRIRSMGRRAGRSLRSRLSRRLEICERRHDRRRRSRERWPLGADSRVWLCVDADRGGRRLGAVQ